MRKMTSKMSIRTNVSSKKTSLNKARTQKEMLIKFQSPQNSTRIAFSEIISFTFVIMKYGKQNFLLVKVKLFKRIINLILMEKECNIRLQKFIKNVLSSLLSCNYLFVLLPFSRNIRSMFSSAS